MKLKYRIAAGLAAIMMAAGLCGVVPATATPVPTQPTVEELAWPNYPSIPSYPSSGGHTWSPSIPGYTDQTQSDDASDGQSDTSPANEQQSTGVVLIETTVSYGSGKAAGTGMVISQDGLVLTNHHVVASSTAVNVTIPSTGQTYPAEVLGYDATADVALLRLTGASGLSTVNVTTTPVAVGDSITAVGNAEGGGELIAAPGQVAATQQNITVNNDDGSQSKLTDLIQMDAALVPGDSGGALLDENGNVVGMNVAGSADSSQEIGYAIPISTALQVARDVLDGRASDTVTIGRQAALGVQVSSRSTGARVAGVIEDSPAAQAGIAVGSRITRIDGVDITTVDDLSAELANHRPGDVVNVTWTDRSGAEHSADIALWEAPLA
ncbi:MAG: S1C family serine protease [Propionibacteriaceae bacterium]|jgi:S1-C subfamily serine protease|nr:S1C family serine protease [Propionibacteriaceae bacterium]